jgi:Core-2/I-Branching enzyme
MATEQILDGQTDTLHRHRFAYMLLTHKDPHHVEELALRILDLSPSGHVVIHHDLASAPLPWGGRPPDRVHLVDRQHVLWGDWSIVDATLRMIRFAYDHLEADWFVMLSGEHRPVVDLQRWEAITAASDADAFVDANPLPTKLHYGRSDEDDNRFLARCLHRWVTINEPRLKMAHKGMGGLWKLSRHALPLGAIEYSHRRRAWFIGSPRRGRPTDLTFYKGSQWLGFNSRSAKTILNTQPSVTEWFMQGHIPDETYLQSVLYNAPELSVRNELVTYVPEGPERPTPKRWMVLDQEDLETVWQSGAAFARKVDPDERPHILKAIDDRVDRERGIGTTASSEGPVA